MPDTVEALLIDLLEWLEAAPRPYAEVMEAWHTSCPRLPVWEEANARGFLDRHHQLGRHELISVSETGRQHLRTHRSSRPGRAGPAGDEQWEPRRKDPTALTR